MTTIKSILRRLGAPVRGEAAGREIEDELRFQIEMREGVRTIDNLTDKRYFVTQNYFESRVSPGAASARSHSRYAGSSRRRQRWIDFQIRREGLMRRDEHEQFNL